MDNKKTTLFIIAAAIVLLTAIIACQATEDVNNILETDTSEPSPTAKPLATPTPLPQSPNEPGDIVSEEPVYIIGEIPYTSPFFLNTASEPFVMLEDQIGFFERDLEHEFSLEGQAIGPVTIDDDLKLTYGLSLPSVPQGSFVDVDNNGEENTGIQVFAIAYWSNTWGDPFLERRDGTGWSTAYASTVTDPDNDHEIIGGKLLVWSPDEGQGFPTDFGADELLFTDDDPTTSIPPGYTLVDLDQRPFEFSKQPRPQIDLIEGDVAVNDYASETYIDAFTAMFEQVSTEYPFTDEKNINWADLREDYTDRVENARNSEDFYRALHDFTLEIPDGHVGVTLNPEVFFLDQGGGLGMNLTELSDGRVIVTNLISGGTAEEAGIQLGAEIIDWDDQPVTEAIDEVVPYFGPYSTDHSTRIWQVNFLTRMPPDTRVEVSYRNPNSSDLSSVVMQAEIEYDSLFWTLPSINEDELALPIQGEVLDSSGLGYIRIITFNDDYRLMAQLWEAHIQALIDNDVPGLIIDLRSNGGGSSGLAYDFAGYFFNEQFNLYEGYYYNGESGQFEPTGYPARVEPGPLFYDGPIAVLIGPDCVSACEGFADALSRHDRAIVIGHYPTAGAFGEVGRGQYDMPDDLSMQFPTGRPQTEDGELHLEGVGVIPDIFVPVTEDSALGFVDAVLEEAISALLEVLN